MELDELKDMLQTRKPMPVHEKTPQELEVIFRRSSRSVMKKIQESIVWEIVFAVLFMIFICAVMIAVEGAYTRIFSVLLLAYSLYFLSYLVVIYRNIQHTTSSLTTVTGKIRQMIRIIEKFVRLYFQLTLVFIPAALLLGFASGYLEQTRGGEPFHNIVTWNSVLVYAGLSAGWCITMYFFTRWYIGKLYGRHLQYLRNQLKALEDEA